jgi:hypothetical protein
MSTESRLQLVSRCDSPEQPFSANTLLQVLFSKGRAKELELRQVVAEAFPNFEIALDYSSPRHLEFKIGANLDKLPHDPRDLQPILSILPRLDEQGDGVRSYVGIATALVTLNRAVYLIDEPETFLHPPQAYKIGKLIAGQADARRQMIVATHSAEVLRGILDHNCNAQIIRIDRLDDINRVRVLDTARLREIANDPLLSAAGVLSGLFSPRVIVTEAHSDSKFYFAVSHKIAPNIDVHIVNADNKQTVPKIVSLYQEIGVRCVGIVDLDVLNNADEFAKQLDAAKVSGRDRDLANEYRTKIANEVEKEPPTSRILAAQIEVLKAQNLLIGAEKMTVLEQEKALRNLRSTIDRIKTEANAWQRLKKEGSAGLQEARELCEQLLRICSSAGLFINPSGELEASLSDYGIPWQSDKRHWIEIALTLVPQLEVDIGKKSMEIHERNPPSSQPPDKIKST